MIRSRTGSSVSIRLRTPRTSSRKGKRRGNHSVVTDDITTTTIRIERAKLLALKKRALSQERSLASLIRGIIDEYLADPRAQGDDRRVCTQRDCIARWSGTSLGEGFAGRDHDEILYGTKR